jgi:Fe-S cluster biogenesis protein NfuA
MFNFNLIIKTTMKLGIDRILRENFTNLGQVIAIDPSKEKKDLSIELINESLVKILPAIKSLGGNLEIRDTDQEKGIVYIRFSGPPRLKKGVESVIKDNPLVKSVVFEALE